MANDIIDINVTETIETVAITVQPNLTTINVNSITSVSPVTSVNGQIGDVVIPTPTLDSVLTEGNTSLLDAKVGRIGLRDTAEGDYGYLKLSENVFTISDYNDDTILGVDYNNIIKQNPTTGLSGTLNFTGITTSRVYTLPDENGEIALKSNIPTYTSQLTNNGSNGTNPFITALDIPTSNSYGLFAQTADGGSVTATTVETSIIGTGVGTLTVPANGFKIGDSFTCALDGLISCLASGEIQVKVKTLSGALLADTGIIDLAAATDKSWILNLYFTIRTLGTAGVASISSGGLFSYIRNGGTQFEGYVLSNVNNTTFNTTINNTLVVTVQWNTNNAGNSILSRNFTLTKIY